MIIVHFDGLAEPRNPGGVAVYGFTIKRGNEHLHAEFGLAAKPFTKEATNNVAEYGGLIMALSWLLKAGLRCAPVRCFGDSQLVVRQLSGEYDVRSERIAPLHQKLKRLTVQFPDLTVDWIPREENTAADALTKQGYIEFCRKRKIKPVFRFGRN